MSVVEKYIKYRFECNYEKLLALCTTDIILISSDGTFEGQTEFYDYLLKTPPTGTWEEPTTAEIINGETVIKIDGVVNRFWMDWPVEAIFTINKNGKIRKIIVRRT